MRTTTPHPSPLTTRVELKTFGDLRLPTDDRRVGQAYQVLRLDWPVLAAVRDTKALLRFRLAGKVAIVDFQIGGSEDDEICRGLVARALCPRAFDQYGYFSLQSKE